MVTYLNINYKREPVKDAEVINIYYKVNNAVMAMDDDEATTFINIVSDYECEGGRANANRARAIAKKYGLTLQEVALWYCLDD